MADTFQLEIVTPEKMVVRDSAEELQIPGRNGYVGILPHHAPLITELGAGEISYRRNGQTHRFSVAWGFAEVLPDRVTVLAETVERAGEINVRLGRGQLAWAPPSRGLCPTHCRGGLWRCEKNRKVRMRIEN